MTSTSTSPPVSARDLFPFEQGERIVLASTLPKNLSEKLRRFRPQIAEKLSALDGRSLTIEVAGDELVAFVLRGELELPQLAGQPGGRVSDQRIEFRRGPDNTFDLALSVKGAGDTPRRGLSLSGVRAVRDGDGYVLGRRQDRSAEPLLRLTPRARFGCVEIELYTRPLTKSLPGWIRAFVPSRIPAVRLSSAPAGAVAAARQG